MTAVWKEIRVGSLVEDGALVISNGYRVRPVELGASGIPFVRGGDIRDGWIDTATKDHIRPEFEALGRVKLAQTGDVAFVTKGTVRRVGRLQQRQPQVVFSPQVTCWRVLNPDILDTRFVLYLLQGPRFQAEFDETRSLNSAMTANHVSVKQQHAFRLPIPPIKNQRVIGDVLGALDDKIELNRRMNRTLAEIAKTLFKSWFIDFDPVQAKIEGRSPEGMDAETAALFPDAFKESELGLIPKGWIVKPASDALEIVGGFTPSTRSSAYWQGGTVPFATHEDLSRLDSPVLLRTNKKITRAGVNAINAGLLPASTILLSSRVPISRLAISQAPTAIGQGIIAIPPNEQLPPHFILHWLDFNSRKIERHAEGSTLLEINERSFRSMSMQLPMKDVVKAFSRRTANLYRMIMTNDIETSRLREVRKTLLPRLLSGILLTKIDAGPRQSQ